MTRRSPRSAAASAIGVYATGPAGVPPCMTRGRPSAGPVARTSSRRPSARYTVNVSAVMPGTYLAACAGSRAGAGDPGTSVNPAGQVLCFHFTLKFLPRNRDDTATLRRPELLIMTILIGLKWPIAAPFALDLLKWTVPKLASGSTRPPPVDGASAMTSAEEFLALRSDLWTVWLQCRVWSVITRVYLAPLLWVTEALKWSPGRTRLEKFTGNAGNISYHAKYLALLPWQSTSVPVCSTVLLVAPSMPTQKLENFLLVPLQWPFGSVQWAETLRNLRPVAAYPDQFDEVASTCGKPWLIIGRGPVGLIRWMVGLTRCPAAAARGACPAATAGAAAATEPMTRAIPARGRHHRRSIRAPS